jgi:hypothetical protein
MSALNIHFHELVATTSFFAKRGNEKEDCCLASPLLSELIAIWGITYQHLFYHGYLSNHMSWILRNIKNR